MSNKKQTAVEWLLKEISQRGPVVEINSKWVKDLSEQAKAKEKEQHGDTWDFAMKNYDERGGVFARAWSDFDDYYNETY